MRTSPVLADDLTGIAGRACCCPGRMHWRFWRYAPAPRAPRRRQSRWREIRRRRWPRCRGIAIGLLTERPWSSLMVLPVRSLAAGDKLSPALPSISCDAPITTLSHRRQSSHRPRMEYRTAVPFSQPALIAHQVPNNLSIKLRCIASASSKDIGRDAFIMISLIDGLVSARTQRLSLLSCWRYTEVEQFSSKACESAMSISSFSQHVNSACSAFWGLKPPG